MLSLGRHVTKVSSMSELIMIAGPQAVGKSTVIGALDRHIQSFVAKIQ